MNRLTIVICVVLLAVGVSFSGGVVAYLLQHIDKMNWLTIIIFAVLLAVGVYVIGCAVAYPFQRWLGETRDTLFDFIFLKHSK
jgi:hypothetical protein